jgi:hypothetical protein
LAIAIFWKALAFAKCPFGYREEIDSLGQSRNECGSKNLDLFVAGSSAPRRPFTPSSNREACPDSGRWFCWQISALPHANVPVKLL